MPRAPERTLCVCESDDGVECRLTAHANTLSGRFLGNPRSQSWIHYATPAPHHKLTVAWDYPELIPPCAKTRILQLIHDDDRAVYHRTVPACLGLPSCENPDSSTIGVACECCPQFLDATDIPVDKVGQSTLREHIQYAPMREDPPLCT